MREELIPFVKECFNQLQPGENLVLGVKKIIPNSWDEATILIFGCDDLRAAEACLKSHIPKLSLNPSFLPPCFADVVVFILDDKRLDAYIEDPRSEEMVDERLAGFVQSMKKQVAQQSAAA